MTELYRSLSHSKWNCKYHLIFIPKKRKKLLFGRIRPFLGETFHFLAKQKDCKILKGNLLKDHVHMLVEIPPKIAVSGFVGFLKGKSAIAVARSLGRQQNFSGQNFWARGYAVSTVDFEELEIRRYIEEQEAEDEGQNQGVF